MRIEKTSSFMYTTLCGAASGVAWREVVWYCVGRQLPVSDMSIVGGGGTHNGGGGPLGSTLPGRGVWHGVPYDTWEWEAKCQSQPFEPFSVRS